MAKIGKIEKIIKLSSKQYQVESKKADILYWLTDTKELFIGTEPVANFTEESGSVTEVETLPNVGENAKLYKVDKDKLYMWVERVATSGEASMGYTVTLSQQDVTIEYSLDKITWVELFPLVPVTLPNVTKIYFKGDIHAVNGTGSFEGIVSYPEEDEEYFARENGWDITEDSSAYFSQNR